MNETTAAFTGPRPHRFPFGTNEQHPECVALKSSLRREIEGLCDLGVTRFLTGAAMGVDIWAAEIVLDLIAAGREIELHAIVPFHDQEENSQRIINAAMLSCLLHATMCWCLKKLTPKAATNGAIPT